VSAIIAAGIIPAALEMLDDAMIGAINAAVGKVYPDGAGAVLPHRARRAARRGGGSGRESRGDLS